MSDDPRTEEEARQILADLGARDTRQLSPEERAAAAEQWARATRTLARAHYKRTVEREALKNVGRRPLN